MATMFWIAGILAIVAALIAVTRENPIYSALFTLISLGGVAVEFLLLHSPFLAAMQILLYAGAIMVLFVFVIMLLSLKKEEHGEEPPLATKSFAGVVSIALFVLLGYSALWFAPSETRDSYFPESDKRVHSTAHPDVDFGSTEHFGKFLYGEAAVPFELVSVLLTAAMAGVVVLARRKANLGDKPDDAPADNGHGPDGHAAPPEPQAMAAVDLKHAPVSAGEHH